MANSDYPLNKLHAYQYSSIMFENFITDILHADENKLSSIGIKSNRFDVIKPGALILQRVLQKLSISNIMTSGVGVREGVFLSDLLRNEKHKFPHNYNTSVKHIVDSYITDSLFSNHLNLLSKKIFDLTHEHLKIDKRYRYELGLAAKLYPAGSSIHFYSSNKHTYYLIQSALEYGFSHHSITLIATLTKYAKSKLPAKSHLDKYQDLLPSVEITNALSYILSLSISLLSHRPRNIDFDLKFIDNELLVESKEELYLSKDAVKKLDCKQNIKIRF